MAGGDAAPPSAAARDGQDQDSHASVDTHADAAPPEDADEHSLHPNDNDDHASSEAAPLLLRPAKPPGKYANYSAVDWLTDLRADAERTRRMEQQGGLAGRAQKYADSVVGWVICGVIGITCALLGASVDVAADLLSGMKRGFCRRSLLLSERRCCTEPDCDEWVAWRTVSGIPDAVVYIFLGTAFASISSLLVVLAAHYTNTQNNTTNASTQTPQASPLPRKRVYFAAGSGIPEVKVILGGFIIRKFLGGVVLLFKTLGLVFSIASGLTLGKQGPLVHIACCVGNIVSRLFPKYARNEGKKREILSASAAAGVSAAFASPIGGVLFSLEEISYYFPPKTLWRTFFCAITTTTTLKLLNPFGNGRLVSFQMIRDAGFADWHVFEILPFILIGVFGGLIGAGFIRLNIRWSTLRRRFSKVTAHPVVEVFAVALLTCIVNYQFDFTSVASTDLVSILFTNCKTAKRPASRFPLRATQEELLSELCDYSQWSSLVSQLLIAMTIKGLLTIITFAIKVPGGVFMPSITVGACFGRLIGILMVKLYEDYPAHWFVTGVCRSKAAVSECIDPALYAMVGAAAVVAGVTRMTVTLAVIMFELTGAVSHILPVMITIMVAKWVGDGISPSGIYEQLILENNYPYLGPHWRRYKRRAIGLREVIHGGETTSVLDADHVYSLADLQSLAAHIADVDFSANDLVFPVIKARRRGVGESDRILVGTVSCQDLVQETAGLQAADGVSPPLCSFGTDPPATATNLSHLVNLSPVMVPLTTSFDVVLEMFRKLGLSSLCVVDEGRFVGVVYKKRLLWVLMNRGGGAGARPATSASSEHVALSSPSSPVSLASQVV